MASTYDITTDRGKVRLRLGDTSQTAGEYTFEDEEIDYFLTVGGSVVGAVVVGLRVLLSSQSRRIKKFTLNGTTYDDTATIAGLQAALEAAEAEAGNAALPTVTPVMTGRIPSNEAFEVPTS